MQISLRSTEASSPKEGRDAETRPSDPAFDASLARAQAKARDDEEGAAQSDDTCADESWLPLMGRMASVGADLQVRGAAGNAQLDKATSQAVVRQSQQVQTSGQTLATPVLAMQPLRVELAGPQAMTLHLQQAGQGHWQMRLKADAHTQSLVSPHIQSLRDRLKGKNVQFDGFAPDDQEDL